MVLVLGIGNSLLQDDGIGCHLVGRLSLELADDNSQRFSQFSEKHQTHLENESTTRTAQTMQMPIQCMDGGTLSFSLVSAIESCSHLIILDAANLEQEPGTVKTLRNEVLDQFLSKPGKSVHEVSLSEMFDMARLTESLPIERAMVAVQPKEVSWGESLTPPVEAAVPEAMRQIESLLLDWQILDGRELHNER